MTREGVEVAYMAALERMIACTDPQQDGSDQGTRADAMMSFAGSDLPGADVLDYIEQYATHSAQLAPPSALAGAALVGMWFGYELRGRL